MYNRKIQLIAGTTYSVSLPKDWVRKNGLKEKDRVSLLESSKGLLVSPHAATAESLDSLSLKAEDYPGNIGQVLFAVYYLGVGSITVFSEKELGKDIKKDIRRTVSYMSGAEISHEDSKKIIVSVLLDPSKLNITQLLYRVGIIIDASLVSLMKRPDMEEIAMNEDEVDRLYHLTAKLISQSLVDSGILQSSGIGNISLVPSFFLIAKKLENITDNIHDLAVHMEEAKAEFPNRKEILGFIKRELARGRKHALKGFSSIYGRTDREEIRKCYVAISRLKDRKTRGFLEDIVRYVVDIEQETINISFYHQLISDKLL